MSAKNVLSMMKGRLESWTVQWTDDLWPSHWSRFWRFFCTGWFTGTILGLALLSVWLIYSSLAG
jgi:hypothetical protein